MLNICMKMSFNIQFFADELCTEKLTEEEHNFRGLYTYEWDKCYKRAEDQYMILHKPVFETVAVEEQEAGPVSFNAMPLKLSALIGTIALTLMNLF